jgi:hypothetical protein
VSQQRTLLGGAHSMALVGSYTCVSVWRCGASTGR